MASMRNDPLDAAAISYHRQLQEELNPFIDGRRSWDVSWDAIYEMELALLHYLPDLRLRRKAWFVRDRFVKVAGEEQAARYLASNPPDIEKADESVLRADLVELQREINRYYVFAAQNERERGRLTQNILFVALLGLLLLLVFLVGPLFGASVSFNVGILIGLAALLGIVVFAYVNSHRTPPSDGSTPTAPDANQRSVEGPTIVFDDQEEPPRTATPSVLLALTICLAVAPFTNGQVTDAPTTAVAPTTVPAKTAPSAPVNARPPSRTPPVAEQFAFQPTLAIVALAGLLGGTFSMLQRAQRSGTTGDPLIALLGLRAARAQILIALTSGIIAALVIYAVFAGEMLKGGLFPNIVGDGSAPRDFQDFLWRTGPEKYADHGKVIVWSFVAGWAERFVPDILDRFTASKN